MKRREFLAASLALPALARADTHAFGIQGEQFLVDGKPLLIRSGEMHYPRVPREYWRDRMRKMHAMGLNTLCTYVFWDLHEPQQGKFDFSGNLDVAEYVRVAQAEGLYVLVRPGPYICTEWDFGGLPWWLLSGDMKVRGNDPRFLAAAAKYIAQVGKHLAPLQIDRGGPILMVQVENEYGSFGADHDYMGAVRHMIADAGFDCKLYTSDGSGKEQLAGGTLDGVTSVINFGDNGNPEKEFASLASFRQNEPKMNGEFWYGWFDHWGEKHHVTPAARGAEHVDWMLSRGISVNLYMAHGGSTWGYMGGANGGAKYEPTISAYDYDAPIDEAGRPNAKFEAMRAVLRKHLAPGEQLPDLPAPLPMISIPKFELAESAPLLSRMPKAAYTGPIKSMEQIGQDYGFVLYRYQPAKATKGALEIGEVRDFAAIRGSYLDRRLKQNKLNVDLAPGQPLDILVEAMGRINFGKELVSDRKGIAGKVTLNGEELKDWEHYSFPLTDPGKWPFARNPVTGPALYRGSFHLDSVGDTFFDLRGWGKGLVWINGHNLGRYWRIGPQQTLFVPAPWLKKGANEAIVLDLMDAKTRTLESHTDPIYETPGQ